MTPALAVAAAVAVTALVVLHLRLSILSPPPRRGLRVLMYHRVTEGAGARYAMPIAALRRQLEWLVARGYAIVRLRAVLAALDGGPPLPGRAVLLTFDDGTADARTLLHPLLRELGLCGVLFAVPGWAGTEHAYEGGSVRFLDPAELREVSETLEIGLHGFDHRDLATLAPEEVEADLRRAAAWLEQARVPFLPALAYPYGGYPRKDPARRRAFLAAVRRAGVAAAFRIGNRVNPLPLAAPLEICRTEIQGDESFRVFRWKVRMGRTKL
jgi:peptidoglycan/xylan/chitin deacetylase (PgdA/CDA1 family)